MHKGNKGFVEKILIEPEKFVLLKDCFYKDTIEVAKSLLGKILLKKTESLWTGGYIVETEAYLGDNDPASHACTKKTPRNMPMFEEPGHAYVYFIYGMFNCFNVVAYDSLKQKAGAVLIRALKPFTGIGNMRKRRNKEKPRDLTSGPGKLCQALFISRQDNRAPLWKENLLIIDPKIKRNFEVAVSGRIGIKKAVEYPYRFYIKDCPFVSTYRKRK